MHSNGSSIDFKRALEVEKNEFEIEGERYTHAHAHRERERERERDGETREWKQGTRFFDYNCKCTLVPNNPVMRVRHRWCFGFRFSFFGFGFFILGDDIDLLGKCLRDSFVSKDLELESSGIWGFEIWGLRGKFRPS